jgi:tetratricopeptide (TPR) repeat protein
MSASASAGSDVPSLEAHLARGKEFFAQGDMQAARASFEAVIAVQEAHPRAHYSLAVILERLGDADSAIRHYERALVLDPSMSKAMVNLGNALRSRGQLGNAADLYRRALSVDPADGHALNNLAGLSFESGDLLAARDFYLRAADLGRSEAHLPLAEVFSALNDPQKAAEHYALAVESAPDLQLRALDGWGNALAKLGDHAKAESVYRRALAIDANDVEALNNVAKFTLDRGDRAEARALFARAAALQPGMVEPRYNLALLDLQEQKFADGWRGYELRASADASTIGLGSTVLPRWHGENLPRGRLAVRAEQGLGDQILFSTLLPEVAAKGVELTVQLDPRLLPAYRRSFPGIRFVTSTESLVAFGECAAEIPIGSLPLHFRNSVESYRGQVAALLKSAPARTHDFRKSMGEGRHVAISWRSFQKGRHRVLAQRKSAHLESFACFERAGVRLVDLQYGDVTGEREAFDRRHPGLRTSIEGLDLLSDIDGVLAAIDACDLVVTTSNVTAHFAGALGKPTWLIYPAANPPFHYWAPGPDGRCLWYPSVEIVTDPDWNGWEPVFDAVARRLEALPA